MRIYIAKESKEFLPNKTVIKYPPNNTNNSYTVEQDFYDYIKRSRLVTENYHEADWIYLPVFWQRHCFNNNYYLNELGLDNISSYLTNISADKDKRYFAVSGMDNGPLGTPHRRKMIKEAIFFNGCIGDQELSLPNVFTIPLITSEWRIRPSQEREYTASFIGRMNTHPLRECMFEFLRNRNGIYLHDGYMDNYADIMASSLVSLCPRGNGLSSFRFFESMQIGVVPVLIAEQDVRPFLGQIPWDEISFFVRTMDDLDRIFCTDRETLIQMGLRAREIYYSNINYGHWCHLVIQKLASLSGHVLSEDAYGNNRNICDRMIRKIRMLCCK